MHHSTMDWFSLCLQRARLVVGRACLDIIIIARRDISFWDRRIPYPLLEYK